MMQDNEQDILLLSAYIDNKLTNEERVSLESRLQSDPALQEELAALRETVALIRQMPKLKAPRSYTLDPAIYGKPRRNILDFGWLRLVPLAAAAVLAVVIGAGLLISQGLVTQKESASESLAVGQRDENTQTESETVPNLVQPIQTATALGAPTEVAILSTIALPSPTAVPTQTPEFAEGQLAIPAQAGQDEGAIAQKGTEEPPENEQAANDALLIPAEPSVSIQAESGAGEEPEISGLAEGGDSAIQQAPPSAFSVPTSPQPIPPNAGGGIAGIGESAEPTTETFSVESAAAVEEEVQRDMDGSVGDQFPADEEDRQRLLMDYAQMLADQIWGLIRAWFRLL